jgi:hypothetical protein
MTGGLDFIYAVPVWLFAMLFLALILSATEMGFRYGRRTSAGTDKEERSWITVVEGGILAVLGLLLAFTMNMAVDRFDVRRRLVVEEANAIGTSFWRAQLVPPPEGVEIANLLRNYVEARLQFAAAGDNSARIDAARARAAGLQTELWSRASAFAEKDPRSLTAGLLLQSLNQTFDLEASRWAAFNAHIPVRVIRIDALVAAIGALLVGYGLGLVGRRQVFTFALFSVCITLVLAVILDLDQARKGLIQESQRPLMDLQQQLGQPVK